MPLNFKAKFFIYIKYFHYLQHPTHILPLTSKPKYKRVANESLEGALFPLKATSKLKATQGVKNDMHHIPDQQKLVIACTQTVQNYAPIF